MIYFYNYIPPFFCFIAVPAIHGLISPLNVRVGHRLVIECNTTGHPLPTVTWYKKTDQGDRQLVSGNSLILTNATSDTEGLYKCVATNGNKRDAEEIVKVQVFGKSAQCKRLMQSGMKCWDIIYIYALVIKNTSESDLRSYEATFKLKSVVMKVQKTF